MTQTVKYRQLSLFSSAKEYTGSPLTILSFGGGQDSTTLLYLLALDPEFRQKYAPHQLWVVMADTGNEHPHTYAHIKFIQKFCADHNIQFYFLTPDLGYHSPSWKSLIHQYQKNSTCGSKVFRKTCTVNLKIQPIYRFLRSKLIEDKLAFGKGNQVFYNYCRETGYKIKMMIGLAKGEEKRVAQKTQIPKFMLDTIERSYPLIELGYDRYACQNYCQQLKLPVPFPSNCLLCPYASELDLVWLYKTYPDEYNFWVELEQNKIKKFQKQGTSDEKNHGVWGISIEGKPALLPQILEKALSKYSSWTTEEITAHKFNHGHCVASAY